MSQSQAEVIEIITNNARLNREMPETLLVRHIANGEPTQEIMDIADAMGLSNAVTAELARVTIRKGDTIIDDAGRKGVVTELRDGDCFFARPENLAYRVNGEPYIGLTNTILITATIWYRNADGSYRGKWADEDVDRTVTKS